MTGRHVDWHFRHPLTSPHQCRVQAVCNARGMLIPVVDSRVNLLAVKTWGPIYKISYDLSYDYRKFIVRSTYDSDLTCAEISLREYRKLIYDTIFDDITILHVNLTYEKLSIHCKMFCKLDVRRMLIVTLALS